MVDNESLNTKDKKETKVKFSSQNNIKMSDNCYIVCYKKGMPVTSSTFCYSK